MNLSDSIYIYMWKERKESWRTRRKINLIYFKHGQTCLSLPPSSWLLISNTVNLHFVEAIHRLIIEYTETA